MNFSKKIKLILGITFLSSFPFLVRAGNIDSTYKYAWGENCGWINFGTESGNVTVTDSAVTGYAWSPYYGWINLNPSTTSKVLNSSGDLSGYAWSEGMGWIDFDGVSIDSNGYFSGYASSTISGRISFNCSNTSSCASSDFKVRTSWRSNSTPTPTPSASYGGCGDLCQVGKMPEKNLSIPSISATPPLIIISTPSITPPLIPSPPYSLSNIDLKVEYNFLINLKLGDFNKDVKKLQKFLNNNGFVVAKEGPGSLGKETEFFGNMTKSALIKFQEKYVNEILLPFGIVKGTGFFGLQTRKFINKNHWQ